MLFRGESERNESGEVTNALRPALIVATLVLDPLSEADEAFDAPAPAIARRAFVRFLTRFMRSAIVRGVAAPWFCWINESCITCAASSTSRIRITPKVIHGAGRQHLRARSARARIGHFKTRERHCLPLRRRHYRAEAEIERKTLQKRARRDVSVRATIGRGAGADSDDLPVSHHCHWIPAPQQVVVA